MADLANIDHHIAPMSDEAILKVRSLEAMALEMPQVGIDTQHLFHASMYARTIRISSGTMITGALIKIETILIISGHVIMYADDQPVEFHGYNVVSASANRKIAFVAISDTDMTMLFPTSARTVADAENEFTDDGPALLSRRSENINLIVGCK